MFRDGEAHPKLIPASAMVEDWATQWLVQFSIQKCECILFREQKIRVVHQFEVRVYGECLPYVTEILYLSVWFDAHLTWHRQIMEATTRARARLWLLRRLGGAGLGTRPISIFTTSQGGRPPHVVLWSPVLGIGTLLEHQVGNRDVPGKEREKTGMAKKLERMLFFPFPFLYFLTAFFSRFWRKSSKTGEKRARTAKKGWKDVERRRTAVPRHSKLFESGEIPFFMLFKTSFCPRSKPVLHPVPNPFLPLSTPILVPFLYCLAIISRCPVVAAQPLDHVGSSPVRGPVGGLYS